MCITKQTLKLAPFILFLCVFTAFVFSEDPKSEEYLTLDLYLDIEEVKDPQISPDGSQIVYTRQWVDKMNDRYETALWIMNSDGSRNRFLTKGSSPRWSPDGKRIAFLHKGEPQGNQLYVRWMDAEGAATQITRVDKAPGSIQWSPDGYTIAFSMFVPLKEKWVFNLPGRPRGAKWADDPLIVKRPNWRRDGVGIFPLGFSHIFIVPAEGGTPRKITDGNWDHRDPQWTPDSKEILFTSLRTEGAEHAWRESEIYAANLKTGSIRQLTNRKGPDYSPTVSPDGKLVAYTGYDKNDDTYTASNLYTMKIDGSNPRNISGDLDRPPQNLIWAKDNRGVYFNVADCGTVNLYFAPLDGKPRRITEGNHLLAVSTMTSGGKAVARLTTSDTPGDIVSFDVREPRIKRLTNVNSDILSDRKLAEVEEIWYTSTDGLRIQGWIVKPPNFDPSKKYPLVLAIHGGPHAMYGWGGAPVGGSVYYWFDWQEHASNGQVVLYTNPRGSTGYGSAFGNAIKNAYPDKDYDDLMAGVDAVIERGYIDTRNMFVYGISGGGVLSCWIVGHTDRFAAAAPCCPVTDWFSFVGTTDGIGWYRNFKKFPWEDPSEHLKRSPLTYVGNVKTPTLMIATENDLRTPPSQAEEFFHALEMRKVPTAYILFKEEWHGFHVKPSNYLRWRMYLKSWFDKHTTKD